MQAGLLVALIVIGYTIDQTSGEDQVEIDTPVQLGVLSKDRQPVSECQRRAHKITNKPHQGTWYYYDDLFSLERSEPIPRIHQLLSPNRDECPDSIRIQRSFR